ncbi:MAG: AAA family ATPase [Phycisphaerales bacterium JB060]
MRVRRVEILHSAGISLGFEVASFGEGLTIIEGRNESGKSTLAMAIRLLLWPQRHESLQARGDFEDQGREYSAFVDLHGGGWQGEAPTLPHESAGRGMVVGIADLWAHDSHDAAIRAAMTRELRGGYDLTPLYEAAQPKSPTAPRRDAEKAEDELAKARSQTRALVAEESRLPELRERAEACRRLASRSALVRDALERLDVLAVLAELRHELSRMPEGALRVRGDEDRRLHDIRARIEHEAAVIEAEEERARMAREQLSDLELPSGDDLAGHLKALAGLENELLAVDRQLADSRRRAEEFQGEADAIPHDLRSLDREALGKLEEALNTAHEARERRSRDAAAAEGPATAPPARPRALLIVVIASMLLSAVAAAASAAWIAALLAAAATVLGAFQALRKPPATGDSTEAHRERAQQSEAAYREAVRAVRDIAGEDEMLVSTLSIAAAADRVRQLDTLVRQLHGARAGAESLEAQRAGLLVRASSILAVYAISRCDDLERLTASKNELERRAHEHGRLAHLVGEAERLAAQAGLRRDRALEEYRSELETLELSEDRLAELTEWLRLGERAHELSDKIRRREAILQRLDQSLAGRSDLLELEHAGLEEQASACERAGEEADELYGQIGDIEAQIRLARAGADVGRALGDVERAARRVAEARDDECAKAARRLILERAVESMSGEEAPALVRTADELLMRFTGSAYGLRIDGGEPVVHDLRTGANKGYGALSTGTRAQALLAMRLASALDAERRAHAAPLPLVLDEPLATTDDVRFVAVARAAVELARDGRQLIYLTCEPGHAARLERLARDSQVSCSRIDLDKIRGRQATDRNPSDVLMEPKPAPSPGDMPREAYLHEIGVRPLDPWASTAAIDLYHLLPNNLEALDNLRRRGISTVGQVLARPQWVDDPALVRASAVVVRLVRAWRRGRARAVAERDIHDTDAVSPTYRERVIELCHQVGGSGVGLLEALEAGRAKGFRANKTEQLRDFLTERGLIPQEQPLDRAGVLAEAFRGEVMGTSDQESSELLATANRLLDLLNDAEVT